MRIHYDEKVDAMYIRFSESKYHVSEEVREGVVLDFDRKGRVVGVEILGVSRTLPSDSLNQINFEIAHPEKVSRRAA